MSFAFSDCYKSAVDGLKASEDNSDWDSGREAVVEKSSRGRHIKRIVFNEAEEAPLGDPKSFKAQKSIKKPPTVSFQGPSGKISVQNFL